MSLADQAEKLVSKARPIQKIPSSRQPHRLFPKEEQGSGSYCLQHSPGEWLADQNGVEVLAKCPSKNARPVLKGKASTWWNTYRAARTPSEAGLWAWSLGLKRVSFIPVQQSLADLMDELRENAPAGLVRLETFEAIRACLMRIIQCRMSKALSSFCLSNVVTCRHWHEKHDVLPPLEAGSYRGVILLKSPMGSGKTQLIGKPFTTWAKNQFGVFLAVCHRRSLVRELANRLGTDHYSEVDAEIAFAIKALATCLPSLVKSQHHQIMEGARFVFIDEIAQVLRSLDAEVTVASQKSKSELFETLRDIVSHADCLIGADAGLDERTVQFLESCRPGERFRIIEVGHRDEGRKVKFGLGTEALACAYGEALARLASGERLWIGCGEQTRAIELAKLLEMSGKRILLLHGGNTGHEESIAFYADPEGQSRLYDVVVHTSVISSGLSIEHRDQPHFDHGMYVGSGATVGPSDALQMLCRVRYLRTWTVIATPSHVHDMCDEDAILQAVTDAAQLEGISADCTRLDRFIAGIRADDAWARSNFAAGLWWLLEYQCFSVVPLSTQAGGLDFSWVREELKAEHVQRILDAEVISDDEYQRLSRASEQTEESRYQLLKLRIRLDMGQRELDEDVIQAWENGRGPARMDRFSAATLGLAGQDIREPDLTFRRFHKAKVVAYGALFDGFDLGPGFRINQELATLLLERVIRHRFMLAYLGLVSTKYAVSPGKDFPMPAYPLREVGEILGRMGLKLRRREGSLTPRCGNHSNEISGHLGVNEAILERCRFYEIDASSWYRMEWWVDQRNKFRLTERVNLPDWETMAIALNSGIEPKVSCVISASSGNAENDAHSISHADAKPSDDPPNPAHHPKRLDGYVTHEDLVAPNDSCLADPERPLSGSLDFSPIPYLLDDLAVLPEESIDYLDCWIEYAAMAWPVPDLIVNPA